MLPLLTEPLRWLPRAPAAHRCESSLAGPPPPPPPSTDACRPVNVRSQTFERAKSLVSRSTGLVLEPVSGPASHRQAGEAASLSRRARKLSSGGPGRDELPGANCRRPDARIADGGWPGRVPEAGCEGLSEARVRLLGLPPTMLAGGEKAEGRSRGRARRPAFARAYGCSGTLPRRVPGRCRGGCESHGEWAASMNRSGKI
jgi:hypothetical protein